MTIIKRDSGCKVGWVTVDNYDEALTIRESERERARSMLSRGYDFGYQSPGSIDLVRASEHHSECTARVTLGQPCDCGATAPLHYVVTTT